MNNEVIPLLHRLFELKSRIFTTIIHTAGIGESQIDKFLGDLETLTNPTVGLAAHTGQVDIRISAKAENDEDAYQLINPIEIEIRRKLGKWIYGTDADTLEKVALKSIQDQGWGLVVIEIGFDGSLVQRLFEAGNEIRGGYVFRDLPAQEELDIFVNKMLEQTGANIALIARIIRTDDEQELQADLITPIETTHMTRNFGGPPALVMTWATNFCLDMLRNINIPQNK